MDYEQPELEDVGTASELIQATYGPSNDGCGYALSFGFVAHSTVEE
jgi:hypothetical protein